jgi:restriction endonuclease S subunit
MTSIPEGWELKRLSDCLEKLKSGKKAERGWSPQCLSHPSSDENVWGVLKTTSVQMGEFQPEYNKELPDTLEAKTGLEVNSGDFLVTTTGPRNRCGVVCHVKKTRKKLIFSGKILRFRVNESVILPNWLMYLLMSPEYQSTLDKMKVGTSESSVSIGNQQILDLEILVPPIGEQHKIVELLEDHLSRLDAALADVKQAKIKAAQFRRSFVHEMTTAIEGSEVMGILDICDVYQPKTISTKELIADGEFPVYGANGQIGFYDKFNHEDSEVTVTCRGATCGTVNVIPAMSWITGNAMVFRPKDSRIQKGFLEYVLRGMDWTPVITGTAQPQITRTSIQDVFVNVPSPNIQSEIYMKLESSLTQVTNAELLSKKVELQAANLRRSLLQAAFTGQLTNEVVSV